MVESVVHYCLIGSEDGEASNPRHQELIQETTEKSSRSRHKCCKPLRDDRKCRDFLATGRRSETLRYVGPFKLLEQVGEVSKELQRGSEFNVEREDQFEKKTHTTSTKTTPSSSAYASGP
ncbi:hypothetical protein Tco_0213385 [Tanacetum coccineum]